MKTLSDDITLALDTTGMNEGYVITTIYHNGIGVFTGHSWIPGDDSSLYVNINDIVEQNKGHHNYLKLNDDGKLRTEPIRNISSGAVSASTRFTPGQNSYYYVSIQQDNLTNTKSVYALAGYHYPNKHLEAGIIDNDGDSELGRLMQGSNWSYSPEMNTSTFYNKILPHYPIGLTNKYGFGIELANYVNDKDYYLCAEYEGTKHKLGRANDTTMSQTFMTLQDLYVGMPRSFDYDTSIYLTDEEDSAGFWDIDPAHTEYYSELKCSGVRLYLYDEGGFVGTDTLTIGQGDDDKIYLWMNKLMDVTHWGWDLDEVVYGTNIVYTTAQYRTQDEATADRTAYQNAHDDKYEVQPTPEYTKVEVQTLLNRYANQTVSVPASPAVGKCVVGIIDHCPARYYLAWYDRYGDMMSQAFNGKFEYSEDIQKEEVKDYKLRRRNTNINIQPKWKLNTTWLYESIYPIYEAIFTSPYVLLYDTETDRAWNVIVTNNNYKEKRFNTEKKLFNLELDVEANTKQNYIF